MPKVTTQKKSKRGKNIKCGKCGDAINVGQEYKKFSKRTGFGRISGVTYYRCMKSQCEPTGSDLASGRVAEMLAINENLDNALDAFREDESNDVGAFYSSIDEIISDAENLRDEIQEGFDNMGEGLQQSDAGQTAEQRVESIDEFIDALNSAKDAHDESCLDDDEIERELDENDDLETGDPTEGESRESKIESLREEKRDEILSEFEGIAVDG